jgi:DNA repair exonuclease SbcCD ATPase subunit
MEDRDLMAELEELSVKEQLQEVQKLLDVMDGEDLQERLKMLERIQDEYQEGRVHEKLEYLYSEVKDMKEEGIEADESRVNELEDRINELEQNLDDLRQEQNGAQAPARQPGAGLGQIVRGSSDLRVSTNENGERVVELA